MADTIVARFQGQDRTVALLGALGVSQGWARRWEEIRREYTEGGRLAAGSIERYPDIGEEGRLEGLGAMP